MLKWGAVIIVGLLALPDSNAIASRVKFQAAADPAALCCGWRPVAPADNDAVRLATSTDGEELMVDFSLALHERNLERVRNIALDVSTPGHPSYGEHLSREELDDLTAPLVGSASRVTSWLNAHGVAPSLYNVIRGRYIHVTLPHAQARDLLSAQFVMLKQDATAERRLYATHYEMPREIAELVHADSPES